MRRSLLCFAALVLAAPAPGATQKLHYPETRRGHQVDDYHGVKVADPYRWLEADVRESPEVRAWVEAENKVTFGYLDAIPERARIEKRLTALWNYERVTAPFKVGGRYFFYKNDGLQSQSPLYMQSSLAEEPRLLVDPNAWSKDGTVALAGVSPSEDGRYLAYGVAEAGSDWRTWHVLAIDSGKPLPEELKWIKFSSVAWTKDGKGFFYGRYAEPRPGATFQELNLNQKLWYHRVGTPQADDVLVHERPDHPDWGFGPAVTDDGRYLVVTVWKGTAERYRILWKDLEEPYGMLVPLMAGFENEYDLVGNDGPVFYFRTDRNAPKRRIVAIDIHDPSPQHWREIVPESKDTLESASLVGNLFFCSYLQDAKTRVRIFTRDGHPVRDVELPGIGTASGFHGSRGDSETFYSFSSFATPPSVYRYDVATGESHPFHQAKVAFDPADFEVKQVFYHSKDGTRVPMFLAYKKGIRLDGQNPTLLYGYGGFNISMTPRFSASRLAWMEMGGVFALANIRGGGEYGEAWHEAGTKLHKQNVFDDFIAAAEWLESNGYTNPKKLAVQGGSNGGLLIGAVLTERPDLFGATLPAVGVMDMLRFQKFTAGRFWVDDYGSSDDPAQFKALYAYSPYQNIKPGTKYPATLVMTADHDDRVVPGHSFKFAAALQRAQAGDAPVLIRIETRAGHGAGKPTSMRIRETADEWAFLVKNLGMTLSEGSGAP